MTLACCILNRALYTYWSGDFIMRYVAPCSSLNSLFIFVFIFCLSLFYYTTRDMHALLTQYILTIMSLYCRITFFNDKYKIINLSAGNNEMSKDDKVYLGK
jgi:hypothetical protein